MERTDGQFRIGRASAGGANGASTTDPRVDQLPTIITNQVPTGMTLVGAQWIGMGQRTRCK